MKDLLIFLADGFEEIEALTVYDYLKRADLKVDMASIMTDRHKVKGAHGIEVVAEKHIDEINFDEYKGIYIPGGLPGATNLAKDSRIVEIANLYRGNDDNFIASICAGPIVFDKAGILKDGEFTCYPGFEKNLKAKNPLDRPFVKIENQFTAMGPSFAQILAFEIIKYLKGEEKAQEIKDEVLFTKMIKFIKEEIIK